MFQTTIHHQIDLGAWFLACMALSFVIASPVAWYLVRQACLSGEKQERCAIVERSIIAGIVVAVAAGSLFLFVWV